MASFVLVDVGRCRAFIPNVNRDEGHKPRTDAILLQHRLRRSRNRRSFSCRRQSTSIWKLLFVSMIFQNYLQLQFALLFIQLLGVTVRKRRVELSGPYVSTHVRQPMHIAAEHKSGLHHSGPRAGIREPEDAALGVRYRAALAGHHVGSRSASCVGTSSASNAVFVGGCTDSCGFLIGRLLFRE